jgi:hypothetical protein
MVFLLSNTPIHSRSMVFSLIVYGMLDVESLQKSAFELIFVR